MAAIAHVVLSAADITPYYKEIDEDLTVPSVYFPPVELTGGKASLSSYRIDYMWQIRVFGKDDSQAQAYAELIAEKFLKTRCKAPLYDEEGKLTGSSIKIDPPTVRKIDTGAYGVAINWPVIRGYETEDVTKVSEFILESMKMR